MQARSRGTTRNSLAVDPSANDPTGETPPTASGRRRQDWMSWIALLFGVWIVGGLVLVLWAIEQGRALDPAASEYHLPLYLGIGALAVYCGVRLALAMRRGDGWRATLPPGYG